MAMYIKDIFNGSISGNAGTATKLANARAIKIGNKSLNFDGSAAITYTLADIGAAAVSHGTHVSYGGNGSATTVSRSDHTHDKLYGEDLGNKTLSLNTLNLSDNSAKFKVYFCSSDGAGANITGRPNDSSKQAFSLIVESLRYIDSNDYITKQTYTQGSQKITYVRYCTTGTWTSWEKVYTSSQKPTLSELGAAASSHGTHVSYGGNGSATTVSRSDHTHSYLPLSGGNLSGSLHLSTDNASISGICGGGTDRWTIQGGGADDNGYLEINTKDNGNEPILCRQYSSSTVSRTAYLLNGDGNTTFPGRIAEQGTWLSDKYAAKSHGHNEIWVKDAPFNSSNDTTANWGGQGVSVSWYPDGTTITNKPNNWGFIFNIGRGTEVHQMWFSQATGTTYHRGGNGSGWSGSWRAMLDSENYSSYAAPASHSHSYLPLSGGTLSGPVQVSGESRFYNTTYSDPWSGQGCAIKATGAIAATGIIKTNQYLQVGSCPLSIQSSAPGCGGVWIQI